MSVSSFARVVGGVALSLACASQAQTLPTAKSIAAEMGLGWNLGNTMEATGGPTAWGNFVPPQSFVDSVKAAGFKTIRLPVAWDGNANQTTHVIDAAWMAQVKGLVDYCIKDSLFVVLNIHWDGGWLENKIDSAVTRPAMQATIKAKQGAYWRQIATTFKNYDRHMLFASTNEPNVADAASMALLNQFHQIFLDTVRATGGNNASRTLIIQGPNTDIEKTWQLMTTLPTDKIADRLMAEVHFYPYQFTLMTSDADWGKQFFYWGRNNHSTTDLAHNPTWGEEAWVDSVFGLMKTQFVDKNIPVLLGEFGAIKRLTLTGDSLKLHVQSRRWFYQYVATSAKARGIIPVAWDAGGKGDGTMSVFDRKTGGIYDLGLLNAMRAGWGMTKLAGDTSLVPATGANAMKVLYSAKDSMFGQVELGVAKANVSAYDSIIVRAFVNGQSTYDSAGTARNGFVSLNLVTMSKGWTWREAPLGTLTMNAWHNYSIPLSTDTLNKAALVPADPTAIDFFGLQAYSKAFNGTIYVDYIVFKTKAGTGDTLYPFNSSVPEKFSGNVVAVKSIPVADVAADLEWKTATKAYGSTTSVFSRTAIDHNDLHAFATGGLIHASFAAERTGTVQATLVNLRGETVWSQAVSARAGANSLVIPAIRSGLSVLRIQEGARILVAKVVTR